LFGRRRGLRRGQLVFQGFDAGLEGLGHTMGLAGEKAIVAPPVEAYLLGLIDGANEKPDFYSEEFDIGERDSNIAGDDKSFIQDFVEDIKEGDLASLGALPLDH
jgi:hypothetical protein